MEKPIIGVVPLIDEKKDSYRMIPVYMPEKLFVWAVQWHPELSYRTDEHSRKIFKTFVRVCADKG